MTDPENLSDAHSCDCVPFSFSSIACPKCGTTAIITRKEFDEKMIRLAQYHFVLEQIRNDAMTAVQASDMADRVMRGERSVRPR